MSRRRTPASLVSLVALLSLVASILAACQSPQPQPPVGQLATATPAAPVVAGTATPLPQRPRPDYTPVPENSISPVVIARSPARGEEVAPGGAIELVFDRPMNQQAVAAAFQLSPAVPGNFAWPDARTLRFTPGTPLPRNSVFDVVLGQGAKAQDGAQLNGAYQFRFATTGFLETTQVIPAPGTSDAQANTSITVIFNRPVVPLVTSGDMSQLPQPLRLEPAVPGTGEWLNTSVYLFTPEQPLAAGTTYTGRVDPSLADAVGNPMQQEFSWQFTVAPPQVLGVFPADGSDHVSVEPELQIQFNQPIDQTLGASAVSLSAGGTNVPGNVLVRGDTLIFTPTERLQFDTRYTVEVAGVTGASGGTSLAQPFRWQFTTVPLPRLVSTFPADGSRDAPAYSELVLTFNTPMDGESIWRNLQLTPALPATGVYSYFSDYDYSFHLAFGMQPSSDYEARLGAGAADPYGNTIPQGATLRFRTAALPPSVQLLAPDQVGTYSASDPARVVLSSVNVNTADLALYRLEPLQLLGYTDWNASPPPAASLLRRWSATLDEPLDQTVSTRIDLDEQGGSLAPGVYLLQLDYPGDQNTRFHQMVVSDINLALKAGPDQALAWATNLSDGAPVANLPLTFYDDQSGALGQAVTDASGVARISFTPNNRSVALVAGGCANNASDCATFSAVGGYWNSGISPGISGVQQAYDVPGLRAYVYTDRPIYRPDQQVHFKGLVRRERDASYSPPDGVSSVLVTVTATDGTQIFQQNIQLNQSGAFDGSLALAPGAALGGYAIGVQAGDSSFSYPFTVAAYRPPEFQVAVESSSSEFLRGTAVTADVAVSYFFGGPVAGVPVQWNLLAEHYRFEPPALAGYSFGSNDDWSRCWECWWLPPTPPEPILSGSGVTDAQGQLQITLPADLRDLSGNPITDSVRLIVEATATGRDNQAISGRTELVRHRGDLYVGLRSSTYIGTAGQAQQIELVAANTQGQRKPGQAIDVELLRYEYENTFVAGADGLGGSWQYQEKRVSITRQTVTTDSKGEASLSVTPDKGGTYRVVATAQDSGGRSVESSLFVWVAGSDYVPWRRENNDRLTLISDRTSYQPGETADILIPSPFTGPAWALVTVERGSILKHEVLQLQSNSLVYRLPLEAAHAPNVFVSVVLFSGAANSPNQQNPTADHKVGFLPLQVAPVPQTLRIELTPDRSTAQPGESVTYQVLASDAGGAPVAAELSLDLVDKAVLSLLPRPENAIRATLYGERGLSIQTASGLTVSANRLLAELEQRLRDQIKTGGDGAQGQAAGGGPALPASAEPTASAESSDGMARESGQANAPAGVEVRSEFADTAFWQPTFTTDASGRGSVTVTLPDNLTTWVLRGVAFTADTRVGEGTVELVSTKPLLVRPVTPRFLVVGDSAELAANVSNNTDGALSVEVALATSGVTATNALTQTVSVPAQGEARVTWNITVGDAPRADLVFSAVAGGYSDAARPRLATGPEGTLPIYRYSVPETVGTGGQLTTSGSRTEVIGLPPGLDDSRGELTLRLDPSLAAGMRDGLEALEHFEYECTEQTVSRFLPNVLTAKALRDLGVANADLEQRLPALVSEGLMKLALRQHDDGGWGWWDDDESNPYISAYVVLGLVEAQAAGYQVPADMLARGIGYLQTQVSEIGVQNDTIEANRQAFILFVLAESGNGANNDALQSLLKYREKLSVYARALLAMALQANNAADPGIKTLLADLNNLAIMSATGAHWEEDQYDFWAMNTDTRSTAIALMALTRLDSNNQLNPNVVRWLMVARRDGIWETTQETAWSLMALTGWMQLTGELQGNFDYAAWLNDAERTSGQVTPENVDEPVVQRIAIAELLRDTGNRLTIGRGEGPGVLYYTAHLNAYLPVEQVQALDRGVSVQRRYTLASCENGRACPEVREVQVGDVIRVDITLIAPNDLYYLRVEDPLPAGAEAVDTGLATTSLLAQGAELERGGEGRWAWWWNWYSRSELRDEKVALFADYLSKGTYEYSYTMRATLPGSYHVIPTTASEFYFPEVYGRSDGRVLTIR